MRKKSANRRRRYPERWEEEVEEKILSVEESRRKLRVLKKPAAPRVL